MSRDLRDHVAVYGKNIPDRGNKDRDPQVKRVCLACLRKSRGDECEWNRVSEEKVVGGQGLCEPWRDTLALTLSTWGEAVGCFDQTGSNSF